jgi:hypothetical protein
MSIWPSCPTTMGMESRTVFLISFKSMDEDQDFKFSLYKGSPINTIFQERWGRLIR